MTSLNFSPMGVFVFIVLPLLLPLSLGIVVFCISRKDKISHFLGLVTMKPVIAYPIWFALLATNDDGLLVRYTMIFLPIMLTAAIVFGFRRLFPRQPLAWIFLALDFLRMANSTWMLLVRPNPLVDINFWFGLSLPSFVALAALAIAIVRRILSRREKSPPSA